MARVEHIGNATLYLGDCREILPTLTRPDAIVTDPPYGLANRLQGGKKEWALHRGGDETASWDATTIGYVESLPGCADHVIIWGGHLYNLPPNRGWLVWDKIVREFSSGAMELAWSTLDQPIRAKNISHGELATEGKVHPTQKPLSLMKWCVGFLPAARNICDPFMGSGTTGCAAVQMERKFEGIELDQKYFDIACRRLDEAQRQFTMAI